MMLTHLRHAGRRRSSNDLLAYSTRNASATTTTTNSKMILRKSSSMPLSVSTDVEMIAANHRQQQQQREEKIIIRKQSSSCDCSVTSTTTATDSSNSLSTANNIITPPTSPSSSTTTTTPRTLRSYSTTSSISASAAPVVEQEVVSSNDDNDNNTSSTEMKDEYGVMDDSGNSFIVNNYKLENGSILKEAELRYQTYGTLNEEKDNVIVVCHALTGNASLHSWWGDLLGENCTFDTNKYFIVCCNILGSCYGSTNPNSINPDTNEPYGINFPDISVQDTVRLQLRLLIEELNINSVKAVIGGSFGGMQAVEYAVQAGSAQSEFTTDDGYPFVRSVIPIACGYQHTAWQIAVSEVQRQAIYKDPNWIAGNYKQATAGLEIARQLGMVSYRTPIGYCNKFGRRKQTSDSNIEYGKDANWQVKNYLQYQGEKFLSRFDPITYVKLTEQMDSHDVTRNRSNTNNPSMVLGQVTIPVLVLGIDSDILYPLHEQEILTEYFGNATLKVIHSEDGHDGFLLEQEQVANYITEFLEIHD